MNIRTRLYACAAQENCDTEEYNLMQEGAGRIVELEEALKHARVMLNDWSRYIDPYYLVKHHFDDDVNMIEKVIEDKS